MLNLLIGIFKICRR